MRGSPPPHPIQVGCPSIKEASLSTMIVSKKGSLRGVVVTSRFRGAVWRKTQCEAAKAESDLSIMSATLLRTQPGLRAMPGFYDSVSWDVDISKQASCSHVLHSALAKVGKGPVESTKHITSSEWVRQKNMRHTRLFVLLMNQELDVHTYLAGLGQRSSRLFYTIGARHCTGFVLSWRNDRSCALRSAPTA